MKTKSLVAIVVSLLLIGTAVVVITTQLHPFEMKEESEQQKDEPLDVLGNLTSFDDAVNAFSFDLFKTFLNDL